MPISRTDLSAGAQPSQPVVVSTPQKENVEKPYRKVDGEKKITKTDHTDKPQKAISQRYLTKSNWYPLKGSYNYMSHTPVDSASASKVVPNKIPSDTAVVLIQGDHAAVLMGGFDYDTLINPSAIPDYSKHDETVRRIDSYIKIYKDKQKQLTDSLKDVKNIKEGGKTKSKKLRRLKSRQIRKQITELDNKIKENISQRDEKIREKERTVSAVEAAKEHIFSWYPDKKIAGQQFAYAAIGIQVGSQLAGKTAAYSLTGSIVAPLPTLAVTALASAVSYSVWGRDFSNPSENKVLSLTTKLASNYLRTSEKVFAIPVKGLDVTAMRTKADEIKNDTNFEMFSMNCSKCVLEIIKAGLPAEDADQFPEAWGWATPADVEHITLKLAENGVIEVGQIDDAGDVHFALPDN